MAQVSVSAPGRRMHMSQGFDCGLVSVVMASWVMVIATK